MEAPWTQEQVRRLLHLRSLCPPPPPPSAHSAFEEQLTDGATFFSTAASGEGTGGGGGGGLARSASSPCLSRRNYGRGRRSRSFHRDLNSLGGGGNGEGPRTRLQSRRLMEQQKRRAEEEGWEVQEEEVKEEGRFRRGCNAAGMMMMMMSSSSSSSMDQSLPNDVLELCLMRLPWRILVRMRLVCKRWRALLLSQSFLRLRAAAGYHEPWMFIFKPESQNSEAAILAYDPVFKKSQFIRAPILAGRTHYSLVVGGGLIYLVGGGGGSSSLVYNPVTNTWRKMPAMHHARDSPAVGVLAGGGGQVGARLIVAGGKGLSRRSLCSAELYDPVTNRWNYITSLPTPFKEVRYGAVHNGKLLVYNRRLNLTNEVAAYDMDRGVWTRLPMTHSPAAPPKYHHFHLMSCAGQLFKVEDGPHMKEETSISVWRLDEARMEWLEVAKIPPLDKGTWLWYIGCVAGKDGQCMIYLYEVNYPNLMSIRCCVCDLRTGKAHWQWVTDMPYMVHPNDLTAIVQL